MKHTAVPKDPQKRAELREYFNLVTEFKQSTYTAVAIGPGLVEEIDEITGKLKLL